MQILKYQFTSVMMQAPLGKVVLVEQQYPNDDWPTLWIQVAPYHSVVTYQVIGTGQEFPEQMEHVGSAICPPFVWHIFR